MFAADLSELLSFLLAGEKGPCTDFSCYMQLRERPFKSKGLLQLKQHRQTTIRLLLLNAVSSSTDEAKADAILRHFLRASHLTEAGRSQPPLSDAAADAGLI